MTDSVAYITPRPEFTQEAIDQVLVQFKNSPNYNDIIRIFSDRVSGVYEASVETVYSFLINEAVGEQLDEIGAKLKIYRRDASDDVYRTKIKLYMGSFRGSATRDEIVELLISLADNGDARIYKGINGFIDVSMLSVNLTDPESGAEMASIFPILADLSISNRTEEVPFGFTDARHVVGGFGDSTTSGHGGSFSGTTYQTNHYETEK